MTEEIDMEEDINCAECNKKADVLLERFGIFGKLPLCKKHVIGQEEIETFDTVKYSIESLTDLHGKIIKYDIKNNKITAIH